MVRVNEHVQIEDEKVEEDTVRVGCMLLLLFAFTIISSAPHNRISLTTWLLPSSPSSSCAPPVHLPRNPWGNEM